MALNICDLSFPVVAITTTPSTVVGVKASTHVALRGLEHQITCDGSTSTATPAKAELCENTFGANAPGTNSTAITVANQRRDIQRDTPQFTAAYAWTVEPTTIIVLATFNVPQYNGSYHYVNPLNSPYIVIGAGGWSIRMTASANVNCSGRTTVEE